MNTVYGLIDPLTKELRYIGCTSKPKDRLREHIGSHKLSTPVGAWVKELRQQNAFPSMIEIESGLNSEKGAEAEIFWMAYYRSLGAKLLNINTKWSRATFINTPYEWMKHYGDDLGFDMYNELVNNSQPF